MKKNNTLNLRSGEGNRSRLVIPAMTLALAAVVGLGTVAGAAGFGSFNLTDDQREVLQEARELHREGDRDGALNLIENSNLPDELLEKLEQKRERKEGFKAVREAVENEDYNAFISAVEGHPLADIIDTVSEFEDFVEAHQLRASGDKEGAREILDELGVKLRGGHGGHKRYNTIKSKS